MTSALPEGSYPARGLSPDAGELPREPVHRGMMFVTAAMAMFMISVNSSIVATALDTLRHALNTSVNWVGWTITAYGLAMLVMLPITGKLADRYGRRRVFLASAIGFTAASLACGFADDIYTLIVLRAIQAAAGAGFTPAAAGLFAEHFGSSRDRAISLYGSIFSIGAMTGPIFGGLFVTHLSWRDIFFINVPIGITVIIFSVIYIPRDKRHPEVVRSRPDVFGAVLLGVGLAAAMLAASIVGEADTLHTTMAWALPLAGVAAVALVWFFRHILHRQNPFILPRLIHGPGFGPVNAISALFGGAAIGAISLVPLYAANRYGITALIAGTLLIAQGAADGIFTTTSALALRRTGYRLPMYTGAGAIMLGLALLAAAPPAGTAPVLWLAGSTFLIGIGTGTLGPSSRNAGLQLAPEHTAMISALRMMEWQIGSIAMVSISTAAMTGSSAPAVTQAWIYLTTAILLVAALPLIHRVHNHYGAW